MPDKHDDALKMDDDSLKELEGAKQGKPRKFLMVYRGGKIARILVFRKGKPESKRSEAKDGVTGEICDGVIVGKGANLTFQLPAQKFDKTPISPTVLRKFLDEAADFKSQAIIEIVPSLSLVLDASNPLVARFLSLRDEAIEAQTRDPQAAGSINELALRIGSALDLDEDVKVVEPLVNEFERLVRGALGNSPGSSTSPSETTSPPPPPPVVDPTAPLAPPQPKLTLLSHVREALFRLSEQVKQAAAAFPGRKDEFFQAFAKAQAAVKQSREGDAKTALTELVTLLKSLSTQGFDSKAAAEFREAWPKAKESWWAAIDAVDDQIRELGNALRATSDEELHEIAEFGLNAVTGNFRSPVARAVRELDVAMDEYLSLAAQQLTTAVSAFRQHVNSSDEIMACDENPFNVKVTIRSTLGQAFDDLESVARPLAK